MKNQARNLLYGPSVRYYNETECAEIQHLADGLLTRLPWQQELERHESTIIDETLNRVMTRYPQLAQNHGADTEQRGRRDITFVYRYAGLAMLLDDPHMVHDKLAVWLKTILAALMPLEPMVFAYEQLVVSIRSHLDGDIARALVPHVEVVLSQLKRGRSSS